MLSTISIVHHKFIIQFHVVLIIITFIRCPISLLTSAIISYNIDIL